MSFELYLVAPDTLQELHKQHVNVVSKYDSIQDRSTGRQEDYYTEYKISLQQKIIQMTPRIQYPNQEQRKPCRLTK